ncbi:MAG TPA: GPW/gp25 family protein [Thermoanaerobaculia bacterium]|nr:GPW/gp25 family protein [Thermoanaerobaculia bacterium]
MRRLADPPYLAFPFRVGGDGPALADRSRHVREQIEQVLFTNPGERVFRPEFGAGIRTLIFEPNTSPLWTITRKRLIASLADALKGEVDPRSLTIDVTGEDEKVFVVIAYTLATLGHSEEHRFSVSA